MPPPFDKVGTEAVANDVLCADRACQQVETPSRTLASDTGPVSHPRDRTRVRRTHAMLIGQRRDDAGGEIMREGSPQKDEIVEPAPDRRLLARIAWQVGLRGGRGFVARVRTVCGARWREGGTTDLCGDEVRHKRVASPFEFYFALPDVYIPHALVLGEVVPGRRRQSCCPTRAVGVSSCAARCGPVRVEASGPSRVS